MATLEGTTAIVTGSSRGIGADVAQQLAAQGAAVVVNYRQKAPRANKVVAGIEAAQAYYHRLGITACQDALVDAEWQVAYEQLARTGGLRLRVHGALEWDSARGDEQLAELVERRASGTVGRLQCGTVKFFHDGVVENRTAAMLDPYRDAAGRPTAEHGLDMYARADLERFVRLAPQRDLEVVREHRLAGGLVHGAVRSHGDRRLDTLTARLAVEGERAHPPTVCRQSL